MKRLTETLIKQRVRSCVTDIKKIVQINITGRDLEDVSLLRKMSNVEIISLSFNNISSLYDFQYCENLRELYLRRNKIDDLNQIRFLKNLNKLERLMLSENPCADDRLYRLTVVKNLPHLSELDGMAISPDERKAAEKKGREIHETDSQMLKEDKSMEGESQKSRDKENTIPEMNEGINNNILSSKDEIKNPMLKITSKQNLKAQNTSSSINVTGADKSSKQPILKVENQKIITEPKDIKPISCKFCNDQIIENPLNFIADPKWSKLMPKNPNLMSATLILIKELDYSSLQIVNTEVVSRLRSMEVDFLRSIK